MGLDNHLSPSVPNCVEEVGVSDWASQVDRANSKLKRSQTDFAQDQSVLIKSHPSDMPLTVINNDRMVGYKKYISMMEIQNKYLTSVERKKRDHALKKQRYKDRDVKELDVFNFSISDSDISYRKRVILRDLSDSFEDLISIGWRAILVYSG
ncbi:hypothetical protein V6N13_147590 [Hibiscus sabdariffa]|uniref:Uncharacterized protein n=1 Tax=Hibiscus sabdariffa TaxID=183260 RepID=A0ABR2TWL1_9ROSI